MKRFINWLFKKKFHTLPACSLISLIFILLLTGISVILKFKNWDSIVSCLLGIISFGMAAWTFSKAAAIHDHVITKVKFNAYRRLKEDLKKLKLKDTYLPESQLKEARRITDNILQSSIRIDDALKDEFNSFQKLIKDDKVDSTVFLGALDDLVNLINSI